MFPLCQKNLVSVGLTIGYRLVRIKIPSLLPWIAYTVGQSIFKIELVNYELNDCLDLFTFLRYGRVDFVVFFGTGVSYKGLVMVLYEAT